MTAIKQEAIQAIQQLPDECTFTDIMAELYFIQKVEEGLKDIEAGRERICGPNRLVRGAPAKIERSH